MASFDLHENIMYDLRKTQISLEVFQEQEMLFTEKFSAFIKWRSLDELLIH